MVNKDVHMLSPTPLTLVNKDVHMLCFPPPLAMVNKFVHMLPPTLGNG